MSKNELISRILEIENILMEAMFNGEKPTNTDDYQPLREEVKLLRLELESK
jgi:hypothetical protein